MNLRSIMVPATLAVLLGGTVWAAGEARSRTFERELPAVDLTSVRLHAGSGRVTVVATPEEVVRIRLEARPRRWSGDDDRRGPLSWFLTSRLDDEEDLLRAISLDEEAEGGELALRLLPRGRSRENRIEESWRLELPSRLAVEISAASAEVEVSGVGGGVRLKQGHGSATVDVPGGDLDLTMQVGRLDAHSGAPDWRRVGLRSHVGSARLFLDGRRVRAVQPPGPGSAVSLEGRGSALLELQVQVGDVVLRLEEDAAGG